MTIWVPNGGHRIGYRAGGHAVTRKALPWASTMVLPAFPLQVQSMARRHFTKLRLVRAMIRNCSGSWGETAYGNGGVFARGTGRGDSSSRSTSNVRSGNA